MRTTLFAVGLLLVGLSGANAVAQELPVFPLQARNAELSPLTVGEMQPMLPAAGDPDLPMGPDRSRVYVGVEYLMWWMQKQHFQPLLTKGDPADAPPGAVGQPGTMAIFSDRVGPNGFSGARVSLGLWLDAQQTWGIEANYFFLGQRHLALLAGHNGDPAATSTLNVPFFNADTGLEDAVQIGVPGIQAGNITAVTSHRFGGAEVNVLGRLFQGNNFRFSVMGGFRYLSLTESFDLSQTTTAVAPPPGVNEGFTDSFSTSNHFSGGQLGLEAEFAYDQWVLDLQGKFGFGSMTQRVTISGSQTTIDATGATVTAPGGLFTGASNSGEHSRTQSAFVPEFAANLGYRITPHITATVGYTYLYISHVARPSDQIDRSVNFAAPATHPAFSFNSTSFWTQGISVGLQFRF
jgi:hypothetical protein